MGGHQLRFSKIINSANSTASFSYMQFISEGVFPNQLKMANVIPLYKFEDPMLFNHYQPVSLLCVLSKVFEKMYSRLLDFFEKFQIIHDNQFGF